MRMPTTKGYFISWREGIRTLKSGKKIPVVQDFTSKTRKEVEQKKQELETKGLKVDGIYECMF